MKVEHIGDVIQISIAKEEKCTLEQLKQNLINFLNENIGNLEVYEQEIELLKVILNTK